MPAAYVASYQISGVNTARDLIKIKAPATGIVIITSCSISQTSKDSTSDSAMLYPILQRCSDTGSGGSTLTPSKLESLSAAASSVVTGGNTTGSTLTANTQFVNDAFNVLSGWSWTPAIDERPVVPPGGCIVLRQNEIPLAAVDIVCTVTFQEIG
jgi:hypothetical protein